MENTTKTRKYRTRKNTVVDTVKSGDVIGGVSEKRVTTKPMQTTGETVKMVDDSLLFFMATPPT